MGRFCKFRHLPISARVRVARITRLRWVTINKLSSTDAAYVAGIIDGEGTVTLTRTHRGEHRRPVVSISSTELPLLLHVRTVVGVGRITNKGRTRPYHSASFAYLVSSRQALVLLEQVLPYLQTYKKQRAQMLLENYLALTPRNGRYTQELHAAKLRFEAAFFALSIRGRKPDAQDERLPSSDVSAP
jgi:hypothetical protein